MSSKPPSNTATHTDDCYTASHQRCCSPLERVRYFPRQCINAEDMRMAHEYLYEKMRRHNRFLHGWGVVCGLLVEPTNNADSNWQITICPGYALTPQGDEIYLCEPVHFDLKTGAQEPETCTVKWPCPPEGAMPSTKQRSIVYLAIRFAECLSRPVRIHSAGCGCDEAGCEYSRIRDSFEIKLLWKLPESHIRAKDIDKKWCDEWSNRKNDVSKLPLPPCPDCVDDPWVILASIKLPSNENIKLLRDDIYYSDRRTLFSGSVMQGLLMCK